MKKFFRYAAGFFKILLTAFFFYLLTLIFPDVFFRLEKVENLYLYHHSEPEKVRAVGEKALAKIKRSSLYNPDAVYRVYLTSSPGEYAYFTNFWRKTGGVFVILANGNIFIRPSLIEEDRVIGPSGKVVAEDRPLNYFIAHEAAHAMTLEKLGTTKYLALNEWIREGYADKIGRDRFDFDEMFSAYQKQMPFMDRQKSGLYLKHQLLIEFALSHKGFDIESLLEQNPGEAETEAELKQLVK
jgi:hypothetical protein